MVVLQNWSNDKKMRWIHRMLCGINFAIIAFMVFMIEFTTNRICEMQEARTFLSTLPTLPLKPQFTGFVTIGAYVLLLCIMYFYHLVHLNKWWQTTCFLVEALICLIIMKALNYSTNSILLLVMADLLTYINTNRERILCLTVMIVLYLCANYDFLYRWDSAVSFQQYLDCYQSITRSMLITIHNMLASVNLILFILYMVFLIQEKINEGKKMMQLNQDLQDLNEQLKDYADIRERMGETRERNRLAREIHDTLGHTLTGLSVGLDACVVMSDVNPAATKKQLALLAESARMGLKDVRRSVDKLRPDALEHFTLQEALDKMIHDFRNVADVDIHFVCHLPHLSFDKDVEEVIYRIIQEGMTNAVRHGKAHEIFISLAKEQDTLILIIEDDGVGCASIHQGFGLHHMQERVELLQGDIRFYGSDGFIILAEIPTREGNK